MAAVFTFFFLIVGALLFVGTRSYVRFGRRRSWTLNPYLPLVLLAVVLSAYLLVKLAYEEVYPCVAVDDIYSAFDSTQYHNLFGWEF